MSAGFEARKRPKIVLVLVVVLVLEKAFLHPYEAKTERCDQSWERRCISALRHAFEDEDDDEYEYDLKLLTASPQPVRPPPTRREPRTGHQIGQNPHSSPL
jgi:hypothetical protein